MLSLAFVSSTALAAGNEGAGDLPLSYERAVGAERCPAERAIQETFREQLAGRALEPGRKVRVRVAPGSGQSPEIVGRVELTDRDGTRLWANELQERPEECTTLVATLALSLRIFLGEAQRLPPPPGPEPDRHPRSGEDAPSPEGSGEPTLIQGESVPRLDTPSHRLNAKTTDSRAPPGAASTPQKPHPPQHPSPGELDRPADHRAWVSLALLTGAAPRVATRITVGYSLRWPGVSFGVEVRGVPPVSEYVAGNEVRVAHWESAVVPCLSEGIFFVCGVLSAGAKWLQSSGPGEGDRSAFRAGGGARAGVELTITPHLSFFGHVDMEGTLWPSLLQFTKTTSWREATGQVAVGFAVAGTLPGR